MVRKNWYSEPMDDSDWAAIPVIVAASKPFVANTSAAAASKASTRNWPRARRGARGAAATEASARPAGSPESPGTDRVLDIYEYSLIN